ncbi:hypothetical protein AAMO2058_001431200 [Amorphochlora amoebiformis]
MADTLVDVPLNDVKAEEKKKEVDPQARISQARSSGETVREAIRKGLLKTNFFSWDKVMWYFFILLAGIGVIVYPAAPNTPQLIWDIFFLIATLAGFWETWNFAYIYALGGSAETLKETFGKIDRENDVYRLNLQTTQRETKRLKAENSRIQESSVRITKALKILGESAAGMGALREKYEDILKNGRETIRQRSKLAEEEAKLHYQQQIAREKRQAEVMKSYARDLFNEADADKNHTISASELPKLQQRLKSTLGCTVDFTEELKNGDLKRYQMIEKLRDLSESTLDKRKKTHARMYEQRLAEIKIKYKVDEKDPLHDGMVAIQPNPNHNSTLKSHPNTYPNTPLTLLSKH